ncbi:MAG: nitrogen fixation protein NifB [Clostridiales bacterium]|jgi:hypothetical protein|nr:nitrogen fixation protein NifB [Clostridiales bacterium]
MKKALSQDEIYNNIKLSEQLNLHGVQIDSDLLRELDFKDTYLEQVHSCFNMNHTTYTETKLPDRFKNEGGFRFPVVYDPDSQYSITKECGKYYLNNKQGRLFEVFFGRKPAYYNKKASDGTPMSTVAQAAGSTHVSIAYSNECALNEKGLDCLFCNINATKRSYADLEGIAWKTPRQIAETIKAAYDEGYFSFTITGGFIPERREVDFYIDVAEAVRDITGLEDFGGSACIGAPLDLTVIDKYKEAGYRSIATNMEIWDEHIFKTIVPGKDQICGGRENWLRTLRREIEVFGRGRVRSTFVTGIEPKARTLEGFEYLTDLGVVAVPSYWCPNPGSALEGHRQPTVEWYHDLVQKTYILYKKNSISHLDFYISNNAEETIFDYLYDSDGDFLPWDAEKYAIAV